MKYIADRGYTDIVLNRHVDKGAELEAEYSKDGKELTEERIKYLVEKRKLYNIEETKEEEKEDIAFVDEVLEETIADEVDVIEDKEVAPTEESKEKTIKIEKGKTKTNLKNNKK